MSQDYATLLERLGTETLDPALLERLNQLGQNSRDPLTGLADCRCFSYRLQSNLQQHARWTLMASTIDNIQELNLLSGWVVGDIAICTYASFLEKCTIPNSFSGRVSGCSFMTWIPSRDAEVIRSWISEAFQFMAKLQLPGVEMFPEGHLTLSVGVYLSPSGAITGDQGLKEARRRMDSSQRQGGNRVSMVTDETVMNHPGRLKSVNFSASLPDNVEPLPSTLEQMSLNGLSFSCPRALMVRETVQVVLGEGDVRLELTGEVVWRKSHANPQRPFMIGVRFNQVDNGQRALLESLMTGGL